MSNMTFKVGNSTRQFRREIQAEKPERRPACAPVDRPIELDRCGRRRSAATYPEFRKGQKPLNAGKKYPPQILTPSEIEALMLACPDTPAYRRTKTLIAVGYRSGLRVSELLGLEAHHIERERHKILVARGKGGHSRYGQLDDWGLDILEAWMVERAELPPGPVFCVTDGITKGSPWKPSGVRQSLKRLRVKAGITKRVHPHALRHTLACELMRDGFPLSYIQHALGHRNPATTASYLVNIGAVESLDEVAQRPAPVFARPVVLEMCPACQATALTPGERVCGACLESLLAGLTPSAEGPGPVSPDVASGAVGLSPEDVWRLDGEAPGWDTDDSDSAQEKLS